MEETPAPPKDIAVDRLRTHIGKVIGISSLFVAILTFGFTWYNVLGAIAQTQEAADIIGNLAWSLYVAAWTSGSLWDTSVQRNAYRRVPMSKAPMLGGVVIGMIALLLVAIYYHAVKHTHVVKQPRIMATALAVLWLLDYLGWRYLLRKVVYPAVDMSTETYQREGRFFELEQLKVVTDRIAGHWKWWRFGVGTILLVGLVYVAYRGVPWPVLQRIASVTEPVSQDLVLSVIFLVFVLVIEGWMLFIRLRAEARVSLLEKLAESYALTPVRKA